MGCPRSVPALVAAAAIMAAAASSAPAAVTLTAEVDDTVAGTPSAPRPVTGTSRTVADPPVPSLATLGVSKLSIEGGGDFAFGGDPLAPSCSAAQLLADESRCPLGSQVGVATLDLDLAGIPQHLELAVFNAVGGGSLNVLMTSSSPNAVRIAATETLEAGGTRLTLNLPAEIVQPQPGAFAHLVSYTSTLGAGAGVPGSWLRSTACSGTWTYTGTLTFSNAFTASGGATQPCTQGPGYAGGGATPAALTGAATGVGRTAATLQGTVTPNGSITTYLFEHGPSASYGSVTRASLAGSSTLPQQVEATIGGLAEGLVHHYRIVAVNASGTTYGEDRTFATGADPPPPAPPPSGEVAGARAAQSEQPVLGTQVVGSVVDGVVLVTLKGKAPRPLQPGEAIPLGSRVDARKGRVRVTAASDAGGGKQTADFYGGIFVVDQDRRRPVTTTLRLVEDVGLAACPSGRARGSGKRAPKPGKRFLWGDGKGRFRTTGHYGAALVRGTRWLVRDSCAGTLVRVEAGRVEVRDFARRRILSLRAGRSYLVRPPRRG